MMAAWSFSIICAACRSFSVRYCREYSGAFIESMTLTSSRTHFLNAFHLSPRSPGRPSDCWGTAAQFR